MGERRVAVCVNVINQHLRHKVGCHGREPNAEVHVHAVLELSSGAADDALPHGVDVEACDAESARRESAARAAEMR